MRKVPNPAKATKYKFPPYWTLTIPRVKFYKLERINHETLSRKQT